MQILSQCMVCQRFFDWVEAKGTWCCEAFPDGIPAGVMDNDPRHSEPIAGDRGLRFVPKKGWENFGK